MKRLLLLIYILVAHVTVFASADSVIVPFQRIRFHDRIREEQAKCDRADGKTDGMIRVSANEEINLQVTDALMRKVREIEDFVETSKRISGTNENNEKIKFLNYIEEMLKAFRVGWLTRKINPALAPELVDNFEKIFNAQIDTLSMAPFIEEASYDVGLINTNIFSKNPGYNESRKILYLKYCTLHPDRILANIRPYVNEDFADSLVVLACRNNPKQLYDYASSVNTPEGKLISRNTDPMVKTVADLSQKPNALFYFPFLDDIISGKQSVDSISRYVGDGEAGYDSVGYFRLLVKTEIDYYSRVVKKDTPVAMFGVNGLRDMLQRKAIRHFITPINELHEQSNLSIRMRAIEPLNAQELYYMMVMGENDIFTSSYKHSFNRLLAKMGAKPRGDQLLMSVNMDYFKKFIKMAANFNQLDTFLKLMPPQNSTTLMKAFVAKLDESKNLEEAVDVADCYSSIHDKSLQQAMLQNVIENEEYCSDQNNSRGSTIYGLLKTIFISFDDNNFDLTAAIGIPSIYTVDNNYLKDDSGRIVQQVFFYGDDDGKKYFPQFVNSFSSKEWKITSKKEWVEIRSLKGNKVWIYVNRPLDSDKNLDDTAQAHLGLYLSQNGINPSIVIHRGHSYWLPRTIDKLTGSARIIVLGSCGGYKNLSDILDISPDAHIISTKEIGKGDINRPLINYLNQALLSGNVLVWKDMWAALTKVFYADPNKDVRESWDDYVPPYKNLGAIFIKAYNKQMEKEQEAQ